MARVRSVDSIHDGTAQFYTLRHAHHGINEISKDVNEELCQRGGHLMQGKFLATNRITGGPQTLRPGEV